MEFRIAAVADVANIMQVYKAATKHMDDMGIHQWDEIYPSTSIIEEDIVHKEMRIGLIDDVIASIFTLNLKQEKEYMTGNWQNEHLKYAVIHRLCVNPMHQNKGVGTQTMQLIENILRDQNFEAVRLDAFSQNPAALRLYTKLGYNKAGEVLFRKGLFYLFEKKL